MFQRISLEARDLLPHPLFECSRWTSRFDSRLPRLLPLDIEAECGGPLARYFSQIQSSLEFKCTLPGRFMADELKAASDVSGFQIYKELQGFLDNWDPRFIFLGEPNPATLTWLQTCCGEGEFTFDVAQAPSLLSWAKTLFPKTVGAFSELELARRLNEYCDEFPEVESRPWTGFRYWPGFLRKKGHALVSEIAAHESAFREALFSPQDETVRNRNGLRLNPTFQVVKGQNQMKAYVRWQDQVLERTLTWQEALLIDEVTDQVINEAVNTATGAATGDSQIEQEALISRVQVADAKSVLESLLKSHLILNGT